MTHVSAPAPAQYAPESFPPREPTGASNDPSRWIVSSPYLSKLHLLDLDTLDKQSRLFALTLTELQATLDYALVDYQQAFDFHELLKALRRRVNCEGLQWQQQEFYVVEFRSKVRSDIDSDLLYTLDEKSHEEATQSGGLLKYWYGTPDAERRNLATCFWRSKDDAIKGGLGPWHLKARAVVPQMYETITVRGLSLITGEGLQDWSLKPST